MSLDAEILVKLKYNVLKSVCGNSALSSFLKLIFDLYSILCLNPSILLIMLMLKVKNLKQF